MQQHVKYIRSLYTSTLETSSGEHSLSEVTIMTFVLITPLSL